MNILFLKNKTNEMGCCPSSKESDKHKPKRQKKKYSPPSTTCTKTTCTTTTSRSPDSVLSKKIIDECINKLLNDMKNDEQLFSAKIEKIKTNIENKNYI